jgi:hypothetical protein
LAKRTQGDVDIPFCNVYAGMACEIGGITGNVSSTFAVAHDPDLFRPVLLHVAPGL